MAVLDAIQGTIPDSEFYREGGTYAETQKWFSNWEPRLAPHGDFDIYDQVLKGYMDAKFHNGSTFKSNNDPWQELGPKRRRNNMLGIGPIRNLIISEDNLDHMLCTSGSGGLFYTTNATTNCTWQNAGTDLSWRSSGCTHAAYYPGTMDHWYGVSGGGRIAYIGGLYRTQSGPTGWDNEPIADHADLNGPGTSIKLILFDHKLNSNSDYRLFIAAKNGLYYSDDPAATDPTWTFVSITPVPPSVLSAYPSSTIDTEVRVHDIEYLRDEPTSTMCAAVVFKVTTTVGTNTNVDHIWRLMLSTDNGENWTEIPNQPAVDPSITNMTVETSEAAPTSFYCLADDASNSWVKSYDTFNSTWTDHASSGFDPAFADGHAFAVDQFNPNSVYVGNHIYMSWYLSGVQYPNPTFLNNGWIKNGHDDVEDIVADPATPGAFWVANHGGVYRLTTTTNPQSVSTPEDKSDGLGVAEVWSLSTSPTEPDRIALGLYHNANFVSVTPYSGSWDPDWKYLGLYGDGTLAIVDHKDPDVVYYANQLYFGSATWKRSDDWGGSSSLTLSKGGQYYQIGVLNRERNEHLYGSDKDNNGVLIVDRSTTRGSNPVAITDFANNLEVNHPNPAYSGDEKFWWFRSNPANPEHLYVGLQNYDWQQRIFRNTNVLHPDPQVVKNSWEEVPHPRRAPLNSLDPDREPPVVGFATDPWDEDHVYVAYNSSVFVDEYTDPLADQMVFRLNVSDVSTNTYPATGKFQCNGTYPCEDITMNLPNSYVDPDCLVSEQGSDGGLYISTTVGVYFTNNKRIAAFPVAPPYPDADDMNNTSGWVRLGDGLPHAISRGMEIITTSIEYVWEPRDEAFGSMRCIAPLHHQTSQRPASIVRTISLRQAAVSHRMP
ncbi:MAG: hypothetical protein IPL64_04880 [Flavobacteriales bacterium]|nr:hypothetical protein [Flavobacteriales bacterium]